MSLNCTLLNLKCCVALLILLLGQFNCPTLKTVMPCKPRHSWLMDSWTVWTVFFKNCVGKNTRLKKNFSRYQCNNFFYLMFFFYNHYITVQTVQLSNCPTVQLSNCPKPLIYLAYSVDSLRTVGQFRDNDTLSRFKQRNRRRVV
jgi:hypothetical protein